MKSDCMRRGGGGCIWCRAFEDWRKAWMHQQLRGERPALVLVLDLVARPRAARAEFGEGADQLHRCPHTLLFSATCQTRGPVGCVLVLGQEVHPGACSKEQKPFQHDLNQGTPEQTTATNAHFLFHA
ncbi:unnamed protein product [Prorocentrum cordatum]|uniref:Uncharacterized protein n=1 Tax=Prorocentrum cordatum TaxID=2364126 RepID=A0ABN9V3T9_9DINO|nr:unnamed protein product [Polarella glacialis]